MLISADRIHDGQQWLPNKTVLELDDAGKVLAIRAVGTTTAEVQYFEGILCPGFINAHCHLELSHMRGAIAEHTGLMAFLQAVIGRRNGFSESEKTAARHAAYQELYDNGVVAVGDISNTTDTLDIRALEKLHLHTFVESLGFNPDKAKASFDYALGIYDQFAAQPNERKMLRQSIVPHAPYSVSAPLFRLIDAHEPQSVMSLHNQETADEDQYYQDKSGAVRQLLQSIGIDDAYFSPTGKSSLQSYGPWLQSPRPLLLVHNTFSTAADVHWIQAQKQSVYWCLCPNANLYIENRLADIPMLQAAGAQLCIGTDSLSSNHQLSVLAELKSIKAHFPDIEWESLLQWACYNGAAALQMEEELGQIAPGKSPGILLIKDYTTIQRLY